MPFCPGCHYEYVEGITRCPDCDLELVDTLPDKPPPAKVIDEPFVPIFAAIDEAEAKVVRSVLEGAGVPVWEKSDIVKFLGTLTVGPLASETIAVPESRADEARKLIEEALATGDQMPESP